MHEVDSIPDPRTGVACGILNRDDFYDAKIIVVGGMLGYYPTSLVHLFDVSVENWQTAPSMPNPVAYAGLLQFEDAVIVSGGLREDGQPSNQLYEYSGQGQWTLREDSLYEGRMGHAALLVPDYLTTCSKR